MVAQESNENNTQQPTPPPERVTLPDLYSLRVALTESQVPL